MNVKARITKITITKLHKEAIKNIHPVNSQKVDPKENYKLNYYRVLHVLHESQNGLT